MRRFTFLALSVVTLVLVACAAPQGQKQGSQAPDAAAGLLPASLDNLFPPKAEQPVYLFRMLGMGGAFSSIVADLLENDPQNAMADFQTFKTQYSEVSKLIPEWEAVFSMEPVNELEVALKSGDQGKVMAAYGNVGKVCHDCHKENMPKVQQKYHWGDFDAIKVQDPLTGEEVAFPQLMQFLDAGVSGISADVAQGQAENAQRQFQGFNARFQALKTTCKNCHDSERKYYVDESVQGLIDKLGKALSGSSVDPQALGGLSQAIGMESCFKCHLVHVPAAFAR